MLQLQLLVAVSMLPEKLHAPGTGWQLCCPGLCNYRLFTSEGNSRQEMFLSTIREVIAPAKWKEGPDTMFEILDKYTGM